MAQAYGIDNYLWKSLTCGANNPANCSYSAHNCTDFAMQRIRYTLGLNCEFLGNALNWGPKAAAQGFAVNTTPALGSVLWLGANVLGASAEGHVAFVIGVGPGTFFGTKAAAGQVVCEQYNWTPCAWSIRVFPVSGGARFIHFKDLAAPGPPPPPKNPITSVMDVIFSPGGLLVLLGGAALFTYAELRKDKPLHGKVVGETVKLAGHGGGFSRERSDDRCKECGSESLFSGYFDAEGYAVPQSIHDHPEEDAGTVRYTTFCNDCGAEQVRRRRKAR